MSAVENRSRRATWLLVAGAVLGVVVGAAGLFLSSDVGGRAMPTSVVARVNGQPILLADYRRAVSGLANDRRDPLAESDRRRVVDRLIDEELLIQRGLELGLARSDHKVRADLAAAVIAAVAAEAGRSEPSDDEVQKYYAEHGEQFATSARLRARQIFFHVGETPGAEEESLRLAREAVRRVRGGEPLEKVRESLGDAEISPLPDALLPPAKLVDYLGPTALRAVLALSPGDVSDPVRSGQGLHVVQLVEREAAAAAPLAQVRGEVVAEVRRRRDDAALRSYLERLRRNATIEVRGGAL